MSIADKTTLANNSLLRLGASTISSFTDGTTASNAVEALYDPTRQLLLRQHPWSFAIKRVQIAASVTAPAFDWEVKYPLPADFIRMVSIFDQESAYKIESGYIFTNDATPLNVVYVGDITDTTQFDPLFTEALILLLAIKLGWRLLGAGFDPKSLLQEAQRIVSDAKMVNGQDQTPDTVELPSFADNMWGGVGGLFDPTKQGFW